MPAIAALPFGQSTRRAVTHAIIGTATDNAVTALTDQDAIRVTVEGWLHMVQLRFKASVFDLDEDQSVAARDHHLNDETGHGMI
jgi:hypothetical protein